jgi:exopolyphosphatase/pppGpp-phosphohydrolase
MDPHPRRTARVCRLALRLFDTLITRNRQTLARRAQARVILRAAAQLHGIRSPRHHTSTQRAACKLLHALPVPPGWSPDDWEVLALVVRYYRGAEPLPEHGRFGRLRKGRQQLVRALAGILRVARALNQCGATIPPRVRAEQTAAGVRLRVAGLVDAREHALRLAAAKRLLETHLQRPLLIESDEGGGARSTARSVAQRVKSPRTGGLT